MHPFSTKVDVVGTGCAGGNPTCLGSVEKFQSPSARVVNVNSNRLYHG